MSIPRDADRYICCVPEVNRWGGMLDCEEVTYAQKPLRTCNNEAEVAVEAIQDLDAYVCCIPGRFGMLDCEEVRLSEKSFDQCTAEAEAAADALPNDDPFERAPTMWDDRRGWCEDRLDRADRGSPERDCSWASCAGVCEHWELRVNGWPSLWSDLDRRDRCEDRLQGANRDDARSECSWTGCAGACEHPDFVPAPVFASSLWRSGQRDRCEDRLQGADRGSALSDCEWTGCAGLCITEEALVCCTDRLVGDGVMFNCQEINP